MNEAVVEKTEVSAEQQAQEESAALSAGYKKVKGEVTAEVAEKKETQAAEPEKKEESAKGVTKEVAKEAVPDPWTGVNPAVKEMLQNISAKLGDADKFGQRLKSFEGRLGAAQNALAAAEAAAKASGTKAPTAQQMTEAMQSTKKFDALMAEMGPDWEEAFKEFRAAQAAAFSKNAQVVDVAGIKKELEEGFTKSVQEISEASTQTARQLAILDIKYPTWEQDVKQPDFGAWIKTQAPEMQALMGSESAVEAMKVLDAYAEHRKVAEKQAKNQARLASVVTPKQATSGGPAVLPDEAGLSVGYNRVKRA